MARNRKKSQLQIVNPNCAGIDIGKSRHYVAVDPSCCDNPVRNFSTFTDDLNAIAQWLNDCRVTVVAMEATGVYWIPLYEVLDRAGFDVHLVNPRATKQVSGRKSDVLDCQWIWQLMSHGLLRGAFRPSDQTCVLRAFVRQHARLVKDAARCTQHIQKALTEMNLLLDNVISSVTGKTGLRILRAIINGVRDPNKLAKLRDSRVRADEQTIARSLNGNWREEHLFALQQALERFDFLNAQIDNCYQKIKETIESIPTRNDDAKPNPNAPRNPQQRVLQQALHRTLGVDLTAIPCIGVETALTIASEIGPNLERFPSAEQFCSWLNLAPTTRVSGQRLLPPRPNNRVNRAGQALKFVAIHATRSKSFIGAAHRARLRRLDKPRAIKATAHQLARLIYAMLTKGQQYVERGIDQFEQNSRQRKLRNLKRSAKSLGFTLSHAPA